MEDGRASSRDQTRIRLAHIAEDLFLLSTEYILIFSAPNVNSSFSIIVYKKSSKTVGNWW
jgi:hypothetical protein